MVKHSVSIVDVARHLGVSSQTVSRVVNGSPHVSDRMRERVQTAIEELGYRQNAAAKALRTGKTRSIGVMLENNRTSTGGDMTLHSLIDAAYDRDYTILLIPASVDGITDALRRHADFIRDAHVSALIIMMGTSEIIRPPEELNGLETVIIGPAMHRPDTFTVVDNDQVMISEIAVDHLLGLGHRTVHHICGGVRSAAAIKREAAWRQRLTERCCDVPQPLIGDWSADSGYDAGTVLADDPQCTAVYAANDEMAYGAIQALQDQGRRVPEDVSVVGVDDSLDRIVPHNRLTTVQQHIERLGTIAIDQIIEHAEQPDAPHRSLFVAPSLVVRGTTAPPSDAQ